MLVCGSGAGAAIAACKMTGIRAAICHDLYSAHQAVEHDDMNVLCLGSEIIGPSVARELVEIFRRCRYDGGERYGAVGQGCRDGEGDEGMNERLQSLLRAASRSGSTTFHGTSSPRAICAADRRGLRHGAHLEPVDLPEGDLARRRLRRAAEGAARSRPTIRATSSSSSPSTTSRGLRCVPSGLGRTGGADGYVSMEVDPGLAHDTAGTFAQAIWICIRVERPNLLVKIPATKAACRRSRTATAAGSRSTSR